MALMLSSQNGTLLLSHLKLRSFKSAAASLSLSPQNSLKFHLFSTSTSIAAKHPIILPGARLSVPSSHSTQTPILSPPSYSQPEQPLLTGSTRTVTTLLTLASSLSRLIVSSALSIPIFSNPALRTSLAHSAGPLFFAALKDRPSGYLNTPLTVVAAGLAKWLDIYSGVLMVRVLLSWFPNIPWERQPLSTIRDPCDPYLNLFRNIIPPIFDTLDVSPLLAFSVLGMLETTKQFKDGEELYWIA